MKKTITLHGEQIDMDVAVNLMDDQIREELHEKMAPCTEQEFIDAYVKCHLIKHSEEFVIN